MSRAKKKQKSKTRLFVYIALAVLILTPFVGLIVSLWGYTEVQRIIGHPDYYDLTLEEIEEINEAIYIMYGQRVVPPDIIETWKTLGIIFPSLLSGPFLDGVRDISEFFLIWVLIQTVFIFGYWLYIQDKRRRRANFRKNFFNIATNLTAGKAPRRLGKKLKRKK